MPNSTRLLSGSALLAAALVLAGCPGDYEGGYEKVAWRERGVLVASPAPDPPPYIAGFGSAGAAAVPTLAAGAPADVTQAMVESGAQNFGTVCSACHGPGGSGSAAGPALTDTDWIHVDGSFDAIVAIITSGVPDPQQFPGAMPPLGGGQFTPEQVRELAAYVYSLANAGA